MKNPIMMDLPPEEWEWEKNRKSRVEWTDWEVNVLMDLWEAKIDALKYSKKRVVIYKKMAKKLKNFGIFKTTIEVANKISNLTKKLSRERKECEEGLTTEWPLYDRVRAIVDSLSNTSDPLKQPPINALACLNNISSPNGDKNYYYEILSDDDTSESEDPQSEPPTDPKIRRRRGGNWHEVEVDQLILAWRRHLDDFKKAKNYNKIFQSISIELRALGIKKNPIEVTNKVNNLRKFYRNEAKSLEELELTESKWRYFQEVRELVEALAVSKDASRQPGTPYKKPFDDSSCSMDRTKDNNFFLEHLTSSSSNVISNIDNVDDDREEATSSKQGDQVFLDLIKDNSVSHQDLIQTKKVDSPTPSKVDKIPNKRRQEDSSSSASSNSQISSNSCTQHTKYRRKDERDDRSLHEEILQEIKRANRAAEDAMNEANKIARESNEIQNKMLELLKSFQK